MIVVQFFQPYDVCAYLKLCPWYEAIANEWWVIRFDPTWQRFSLLYGRQLFSLKVYSAVNRYRGATRHSKQCKCLNLNLGGMIKVEIFSEKVFWEKFSAEKVWREIFCGIVLEENFCGKILLVTFWWENYIFVCMIVWGWQLMVSSFPTYMISLVSDLSARFCGGKINGETDQPGEYRAICLWNVEGQALQFFHFWIE